MLLNLHSSSSPYYCCWSFRFPTYSYTHPHTSFYLLLGSTTSTVRRWCLFSGHLPSWNLSILYISKALFTCKVLDTIASPLLSYQTDHSEVDNSITIQCEKTDALCLLPMINFPELQAHIFLLVLFIYGINVYEDIERQIQIHIHLHTSKELIHWDTCKVVALILKCNQWAKLSQQCSIFFSIKPIKPQLRH